MDSPDHAVDPALGPLPAPPATVQWWLVTPSPMEFENIGFSRPVVRTGNNAGTRTPSRVVVACFHLFPIASPKRIKFLICADCDVGPLGWSEEGGKEFWLACSRVKYAVPRSG